MEKYRFLDYRELNSSMFFLLFNPDLNKHLFWGKKKKKVFAEKTHFKSLI